ncbi:MAG TPA: heparan-alpha-glucosaminide N-acetyltransferase domain-containing protein, partial [Thermoanaerobaculia bacterium]
MEARPAPSSRIASVDVIRGAIMLLMAVDHVRLYLTNANFDPMDLSKTSVPLFLTRWVTHFCAPGFVFLAGTGAYLRGRRGSRGSLAKFLLVRGLWLILLEVTIVRLGWTFNFDYRHYVLLGVLWMLGWAMVALAGLVFLPYHKIAAIGFVVVFGHNLLDRWLPARYDALLASPRGWLWQILYLGGTVEAGPDGPLLAVLYSLVPWIGVIALGYAFGRVLTWPDERRRRACLAIGGAAVFLFLVLRGGNLYGNPSPWKPQASACRTALAFLNTRKYPASLQ